MINKGLWILNHNVPCSCACRYCLLRSHKKAENGVPYERGKEMAFRFDEWRKKRKPADFWLSYTIGYCADYPELVDNIAFNKAFDYIGFRYLQINGIRFRSEPELFQYLKDAKDAGVTHVDTSFYGLEEYHDRFAARKGDFQYLIKILKVVQKLDLKPQISIPLFEDNKDQIEELVSLLEEYVGSEGAFHIFLQDYRGYGEHLERVRLLRRSYEALPNKIKRYMNLSRYKTEEKWLRDGNFPKYTSRNLHLVLGPDTIDMLEKMTCDEIVDYLVGLDEAYYEAIPDIHTLAGLYGNIKSQKLYRQRDLQWKWQKRYIADHNLKLHDVTDERLCGSMRF